MKEIKAGPFAFMLETDLEGWQINSNAKEVESGLWEVRFFIENAQAAAPPLVKLSWKTPMADVIGHYSTAAGMSKGLRVDWDKGFECQSNLHTPLISCFNAAGINRCTVSLSEVTRALRLGFGICESTSSLHLKSWLFEQKPEPGKSFEVVFRIDRRRFAYEKILAQASRWYRQLSPAAEIPDFARHPVYSTWYSFHRELTDKKILEECRLAKELGCESVIIDDGWQKGAEKPAFSGHGDWELDTNKIPDMQNLVKEIHDLNMKVMLWVGLPFAATGTAIRESLKDCILFCENDLQCDLLDPRKDKVKEHLGTLLPELIKKWDLDGLKIDFVDLWLRKEEGFEGLAEAVDELITDLGQKIKQVNPKAGIEFRQKYVGPRMRSVANMLRVADCAGDCLQNRVASVDMRLVSGETTVHSDMLVWDPQILPEDAALQILNSFFSVPQISMLPTTLSEEHSAMLKFWLSIWNKNRELILDGELNAFEPIHNYPLVTARDVNSCMAVFYAAQVLDIGEDCPEKLSLINAGSQEEVNLRFEKRFDIKDVKVFDCQGRKISGPDLNYVEGLVSLKVPRSGLLELELKA